MDNFIYDVISRYYNTLEKTGYVSYSKVTRLLVLLFYYNYVFKDFRGILSDEDYHAVDKALYCLFGSSCLIPYPDYLKMGKLNLGSNAELAKRVKALEDAKALKLIHDLNSVPDDIDSDIEVYAEDED